MQKTNIKASILIWSIFLSLIITILFMSISIKVNKNLKNNINFSQQINDNNQIKNLINSWSISWIYTSQYLNDSEKIYFQAKNKVNFSLKIWEKNLSKIYENNNISISIISGWPIKYSNNTNSGIIETNKNISITPWDLEIKNLWWYSKIEILSNVNTNSFTKYSKYKIYKDIWNKQLIKTIWTIKNF